MNKPCPVCDLVALRRLGPLAREETPETDVEEAYLIGFADGAREERGWATTPPPDRRGKLCPRHTIRVAQLLLSRGEKAKRA